MTATFERVETLCAAFDSQRSQPALTPVISGWGEELRLLRR